MSLSLQGIRDSASNAMHWVGQEASKVGQTFAYYGSKATTAIQPVLDTLIAKIRSVTDLAPAFLKNDLAKGLGTLAFGIGLFVIARRYPEHKAVQAVCIVAGALLLAVSVKLALINPGLALAASRV